MATAMEPEIVVTTRRSGRAAVGPSETIDMSEDIEDDVESYDEDEQCGNQEREWSESGSSKSWHSGGSSSYSSRTTSGSRSRSSSTGSRSCTPCSSSRGSSYLDEGVVDGRSTSTSISVPNGPPTAERPYPQYPEVSMYFMMQTTRPRTWCLRMLENPWFERVSMMAILLNCVTLGMYHPCADEVCTSYRCRTLEVFDDLIFAFFAIEMVIKMVAMGIAGKGGYLVEKWNRIDFIIVLAGLAEYISDVGSINLTAVRTIRVLRPLRAINRIPSMRILVMLLLDTLPMLGNVLLLCFFVFFIFGIVGVQLWSGILRQRCHFQLPPNVSSAPVSSYYHSTDAERDYICSLDKDNGLHRCHNLPPLVVKGVTCTLPAKPNASFEPVNNSCINWNQYYVHCKAGDRNPFQGAISFDNIGLAWVAIFLVISLEGWTDIMYYIQDAHSFWDWIYFVLLIVIGSFFMINLCLVVIATQFSETKKREMERMRIERADSSNSTIGSNVGSEPTGCYNQTVKYIAHLCRHAKRRTVLWCRQHWRRKRKDEQPKSITLRRKRHKPPWQPGQSSLKRTPQPEVPDPGGGVNNYQLTRASFSDSQTGGVEGEDNCGGGGERVVASSDDVGARDCGDEEELAVDDSREDLYAPCASPEISDIDPLASPRRPNVLKFNRGASQRLRDKDNICQEPNAKECAINIESQDDRVAGGTTTVSLPPGGVVAKRASNAGIGMAPPVSSSPKLLLAKQPSSGSSRRTSNLTCAELLALSGAQGAALAASLASSFAMQRFYSSLNKSDKHCSAPQLLFYYPENDKDLGSGQAGGHSDEYWSESDYCSELDDERREASPRGRCYVTYKKSQTKIKLFVDNPYFQRGILMAILVNTLSMGIEYHNQPEELTLAVEISNLIFTAIFALEMALKILAEGFYAYISSGFNVFDGVIVILSVVELFQSSGSGLSVLRTFRLLRILKLVRFMPALRRQLVIMLRTIDNVAVFFALLILFIFIFSCLGMHLFGGKFCSKADDLTTACTCEDYRNPDTHCICDRKHFDSFLWATVTVFQILTQEDWNVVLFNGMEKTSHWAALYFVALMTFGNYVLFNLLVAILVEGFSQDSEKKRSDEKLSEEINEAKSNEQRATDEHLFYCKDIDDYDPKDNIEKETRMLCRPSPLVSVDKNGGGVGVGGGRFRGANEALCFPPIITRTAATPQGSPNATLEPFIRDLNNKLSPLMAFNISASSIDSIDKSDNGLSPQVTPNLSRTSSNRSSFTGAICLSVPRSNLIPCTTSSSCESNRSPTIRNNSPTPFQTKQFSFRRGSDQRKGSLTCGGGTGGLERQGSACSAWGSKRRAQTRKYPGDKQNLVDSDEDEEEIPADDQDDCQRDQREEIVLNNMTPNLAVGSQCNGGLPTIRNTPNNKRQIGSMRINPLGGSPKTLSPRNSIRESSGTNGTDISRKGSLNAVAACCSEPNSHPALTPRNSLSTNSYLPSRQNSIGGSSIKDDFKPNNLDISRFKLDNITPPAPTTDKPEITGKICFYFKPRGCFENREDYSLYVFGPENKIRCFCAKFAALKCFDYVILVFIALNCITLAMERPNIPPDSIEKEFLNAANYIFTAVFGVEMLVKVIAKGLWYGEHAYFKSGWNVMDGTLVIISLVDLFLSFVAFGSTRIFGILRVFRLLRSLRPLRVINRAPGLKLVVQTLLSSLRPIGNIVLICCTFFIIFGILGVQLFKGSLYYCDGPDVRNVKNKTDCISDPKNLWLNRKYNFDNLGQALMALFVLSSKDGWVNIMYSGLDAVGVDQQPIENFNQWRLLYFISFLLLVAFFVLNMFVGVVVENFHRCREEQEKEERAMRAAKRASKMEKKRRSNMNKNNETDRKLIGIGKEMRAPPYYINYSKPRLFTHNIVTSKYFDLAIAAVIGLNVVTMAMEFYMMPAELEYALKIFNYFFTAVFILEAAMKVMALGIPRYLKDKWNQLDVFIVCLSVCGIVLEEMKSEFIPINPTIIRVMRVLRIARVLKLLKMAKGIRALLDTVMQALPQVGNLGLLFFLLFFIFAALGVELFGRLECNESFPCQGLGEHAHFRNFGMAFLTLFRVATGDNWNGIMKDTLRDDCDNSSECVKNCCVSGIIAPLYFVIFVLMAQFVLVNVVVAVLMKHLEESHKNMDEDIEMEIEREMVAEARQAQLALQHEARQASRRHRRHRHHHHRHHHRSFKGDEDVAEVKLHESRRRPLLKMSSLPANFVFTFRSDRHQLTKDSKIESTPNTTVSIRVTDVSSPYLNSTYNVSNHQSSSVKVGVGVGVSGLTPRSYPENNVNLRRASPDETRNKVTVADLSHIPLRIRGSVPNLRTPPRGQGGQIPLARTIGTEAYRSLPGSAIDLTDFRPKIVTGSSNPSGSQIVTEIKSPIEATKTSEYSNYYLDENQLPSLRDISTPSSMSRIVTGVKSPVEVAKPLEHSGVYLEENQLPSLRDISSISSTSQIVTEVKSPIDPKTSEYSSVYLENAENQLPSLRDISLTSYDISSSNSDEGHGVMTFEPEPDDDSVTSASFSVVGVVGCVSTAVPVGRYNELGKENEENSVNSADSVSRTNSLVSDWGSDSSRTLENVLDDDQSRGSIGGRTLLLRSSTEGEDGSSSAGPVEVENVTTVSTEL